MVRLVWLMDRPTREGQMLPSSHDPQRVATCCGHLSLTGFDEFELGELFAERTQGRTDPDDAPEPPAHPVAEPGDLWVLGRHRLLCGDSTVATDVARVLGGVAPHLMVTDRHRSRHRRCGRENCRPRQAIRGSRRASCAPNNRSARACNGLAVGPATICAARSLRIGSSAGRRRNQSSRTFAYGGTGAAPAAPSRRATRKERSGVVGPAEIVAIIADLMANKRSAPTETLMR